MVDNVSPTFAPAISLKDVSFSYGEVEIFSEIDLVVPRGEFLAVLGSSGVGKSTLLNIIRGFLTPSGLVEVEGRTRTVFQSDRLLQWYTSQQNIELALFGHSQSDKHNDPIGSQERKMIAKNLLGKLGMEKLADRYPSDLSGGERQRVAVLRAFAANPNIVLMDEPFGNLDILTKENLQLWLLEFWETKSCTVVFVTHDIEEALILGDRILVIEDGHFSHSIKVELPRPRTQNLRLEHNFLDYRERFRKLFLDNGLT